MSCAAPAVACVLDASHRHPGRQHPQVTSHDLVDKTAGFDGRVELFNEELSEEVLRAARQIPHELQHEPPHRRAPTLAATATPAAADKGSVAAHAVMRCAACSQRTRRSPALVLAPARPAVIV